MSDKAADSPPAGAGAPGAPVVVRSDEGNDKKDDLQKQDLLEQQEEEGPVPLDEPGDEGLVLRADLDEEVDDDYSESTTTGGVGGESKKDKVGVEEGHSGGGQEVEQQQQQHQLQPKPRARPKAPDDQIIGDVKRRKTSKASIHSTTTDESSDDDNPDNDNDDEEKVDNGEEIDGDDESSPIAPIPAPGPSSARLQRLQGGSDGKSSRFTKSDDDNKMDFSEESDSSEDEDTSDHRTPQSSVNYMRHGRSSDEVATTSGSSGGTTTGTSSSSGSGSGGPARSYHPHVDGNSSNNQSYGEVISKLNEATRRYQRSITEEEEEVEEYVASTSTSRFSYPPGGRMIYCGARGGIDDYFRNPIYETNEYDGNIRRRVLLQQQQQQQQSASESDWGSWRGQQASSVADSFDTADDQFYSSGSERSVGEHSLSSATLEEEREIAWSRKLFRSTFDYVFPGFAQGAAFNNIKTDFESPIMRPLTFRYSTPLQCLLRAEALYFVMWLVSFVYMCDVRVGVLKELHGNLVMCMAGLFSIINVPRIIIGLKASVNERLEMLALFWMVTFIVQLPLLGFILFTDLFTFVQLPFTIVMDAVIMAFIVLELSVSSKHLQLMVSGELTTIELMRKSMDQNPRKVKRKFLPIPVQEAEGVVGSAQEQINYAYNDSEDESGSEVADDENIEYSMQIQELQRDESEHEQPERDDSNQVSSTSDSLSQRPIEV